MLDFRKVNSLFRHEVSLKDLPAEQRYRIYKSIIVVNSIFILVLLLLSLKIHRMTEIQDYAIQNQITKVPGELVPNKVFMEKFTHGIDTNITLYGRRYIDPKVEVMPIEFGLTLSYPESWVKEKMIPKISLDNGTLNSTDVQYNMHENGIVEMNILYSASIQTNFMPDLYPLDKQVLIIETSALVSNESGTNRYYFKMNNFRNLSSSKSRNYKEVDTGFYSQAHSYTLMLGKDKKGFYDLRNHAYIIFKHKNIYSFLKTTQYLILSILITVFALLLSPKESDSMSGRISVTGSAVFSLSANVFQINSLIKPVSNITLIDLISAFAGLIIITCFLITVKTIKIREQYGFDASKVHDLTMFKFMLFYPILFFILTYLQT